MGEHLPTLITDLGLILCVGAVTTLIFKRINQPLVLGYIIAGFLVSPHFSFIPSIADEHNVEIWAKIGVIFLLFSLGLEFSFKKLLNVGGSASITAIVEIFCIVTVGYFAGRFMNWSTMDSVFLGGILASSSTTIIIRAFDELGLKRKKFAKVVFGILIVEDIVVILLMVMLSTMAVSQHFNGGEMVVSFIKLGFFLAVWFIGGIFIIPTFLRSIKNYLDDETLLVISVGLCLGMVYIADSAGFSIELGAFVMGSILAETVYAEKIEHNFESVKNLFATIFFISIGMMIDPVSMYEHKWTILIVTLITILGKLLFTAIGAIISGQPLKQSVQVGMSMAQIGEFAFIVAGLGLSLGVTSDFLFPVAIGVSAITTFTTPYLIKSSEVVYNILIKILPQKVIKGIESYSSDTQRIHDDNKWKKIIIQTISTISINSVIIIAITLIVENYFLPFLMTWFTGFGGSIISLVITFILCIPFIWAIIGSKPKKEIINEFWDESIYNRAPLIAIISIRLTLVVFCVIFIYNQFFSSKIASLILALVLLITMYYLSKYFNQFYNYIQTKFIFNLNEREIIQKKNEEKKKKEKFQYTWDNTHISDMIVPQNANFIGVPLGDLDWRTKFHINIAYIKRGDRILQTPNSESALYPFDKIGIIGNDEQLQKFERYLQIIGETPPEDNEIKNTDNFTLQKVVVPKDSSILENKTVGDIKDDSKAIVVSIERDGKFIQNPDRNAEIKLGDYLTIVADKKSLKSLIQKYELK
ncbi:cation:proton antiporter [Chishuiella sp.]|uniref:cation:proton antiporter domain-containing protein n=1 Tax=Chishuiella sp. TaxID=1969467 RepID=UPI0028AE0C21|nr:cation:proton antiporter [Chishuiella sp.]